MKRFIIALVILLVGSYAFANSIEDTYVIYSYGFNRVSDNVNYFSTYNNSNIGFRYESIIDDSFGLSVQFSFGSVSNINRAVNNTTLKLNNAYDSGNITAAFAVPFEIPINYYYSICVAPGAYFNLYLIDDDSAYDTSVTFGFLEDTYIKYRKGFLSCIAGIQLSYLPFGLGSYQVGEYSYQSEDMAHSLHSIHLKPYIGIGMTFGTNYNYIPGGK